MPLELDATAPVRTVIETDVDAPPEVVWSVLTCFAAWPEWMPMIAAARLEGLLAPGSVLHWSIAELDIESTLHDVEPGRRLAWTGVSGEQTGVHVWRLERTDTGTRLINAETITGVPDPEAHESRLDEALGLWSRALKVRAESRQR